MTRAFFIKPIILAGTLLILFSCKKKEEPEPQQAPEIELISIAPTTLVQFKDSVIIKIKYKDVNGDIGEISPEIHPLHVKDARLSNADTYHVKPLAPISDKNIPIQGELTIKLNSMFLLGTGISESTTLSIKLKDRKGNWSNEINSPVLTITK